MALTGIDPNDPIPATRRELIFGAGMSSAGSSRDVVLFGNYTTTIPAYGLPATYLDVQGTVGPAIADDADCATRFGQRSELYRMYRSYVAVDPGATIYAIPVIPAAGGVAGACTLTYVNTATAATTQEIDIQGTKVTVPIAVGDTPTVIAAAAVAAINGGDGGRLEVAASAVAGVVTVSCSQVGVRGAHIVGNNVNSATGLRVRFQSTTNVTCTKANPLINEAAGIDDFSQAIDSAEARDFYYHVTPKHTVDGLAGPAEPQIGDLTALSATDNGLGEHIDSITTQALPINGKESVLVCAAVGTQAQHTEIGTYLNSARAFVFSQERSDWTPGMLAAHHAAVVRSQQISHPGANFADYSSSDQTIYKVPAQFDVTNWPSTTEIRADLNNGVCPVAINGVKKPYLVRFITSRCLNGAAPDYRARPGHVTSVIDFAWNLVKQRWLTTKQPFVADDPVQGAKPLVKTSTPGYLKALIFSAIDDLSSNKPLGLYDGPILAPDKVAQMKASVKTSKIGAGLTVQADFFAVEHLYKGEFTFRETGEGY